MAVVSVDHADHPLALRFTRERVGSLSERAYATLRAAILAGDLLPGTKLREADLIGILPISRTPLREALRRLEAEQLVVAIPNRGVTVRGVSAADAIELYQVIAELEAMAARLAAPRIPPAHLVRLAQAIDLVEFYLERERWDEMTAQAMLVHEIIYETCGNRQLVLTLRGLREKIHRFRRFGTRDPARKSASIAEHQAILAALSAHDSAAAGTAMYEHIVGPDGLFLAILADLAPAASGMSGTAP